MDEPDLNDDFRDMLAALVHEHVEFVIVGAHALAAHGLPRATGDLDVLVRPSRQNAERVLAALRRFGAPLAAHGVSELDFQTPGNVYQIGLPPRRIDLLTEISGVSFDDAVAQPVLVEIDGQPIAFLGREPLLANKRATGRAKDLVDVEMLERSAPAAR